jgi:hypothetical protein
MVLIIVAPLRKYGVHYHKSPPSTKKRGKILRTLHGSLAAASPYRPDHGSRRWRQDKTMVVLVASNEKRIKIP